MLTNVKKIMLFINLLNNRESVTKKEVHRICGIEKRTFYRYINILSEINIPIFYDKSVGGYRLTNQVTKQKQYETINEIILQTISLIKYSKTLKGEFRNEANYLIKKIISLSKFDIEDIINAYLDQINNNNLETDEISIIKSIIIDLAIENSFPIIVSYKDIDDKEKKVKIESPMLEYNKDWLLSDKSNSMKLPLNNISHVKIV